MLGCAIGGFGIVSRFTHSVRRDAIAEASGGSFFAADSLEELDAVYEDIGSAIGYETVDREITDWFVGAGLATLLLSTGLSLWWFQRLL